MNSTNHYSAYLHDTGPRISVIVPAHNAEAFISTAIVSVLKQTIRDLEVVVVDDGSTDKSADKVRGINDSRVRLFQQENQGQSAAINFGVNQSTGEYIKLLDADDFLNPDHLAAQLAVLENSVSCVASCHWGYFVADPMHPVVREEAVQQDYDEPLEWLVDSLSRDEGMMGGWMWLIPKALWDKAGGYDPRLSLNNDFHFSIKLLLASEGVRFADGAIYSYRKGIDGPLSARKGREAMESAYLTTELGTRLLLEREDSPRIRKVCADRFQQWLFQFYPEYPDLVSKTERHIESLGGSELELAGGRLLDLLLPLLGWKRVRRMQRIAYRHGWQAVLQLKARKRRAALG